MNLPKWLLPVGLVLTLIFIISSWFNGINNRAVILSEDAKSAWGNVETTYQRRNDLIGNLVNTVKGAANFEKSTLTDVISARAKATSVTIDPSNISPAQLEQFQKTQSGVSSALSRLLVSVEKYPELKANANFTLLQTELEGTENRIKFAREEYNRLVKPYNIHVKKFPNSIIVKFLGFSEMAYFQSQAGAENAPTVDFK